MPNRFGLKRNIPEAIMLEVRKRCGFGCVICGKGIIQYDHFDPEYVDAESHTATGITLLCGSCHDEKKHGLLTNEQISEFNDDPFCRRNQNAFGIFRLGRRTPKIQIGATIIQECVVVLEMCGERVLWFNAPKHPDEGLRFNARIRDKSGAVILEIKDNEWTIGDNLWDVQTSGNGIVVRSRPRNISLVLRFLPPDAIKIERATINHDNRMLSIKKDGTILIDRGLSISSCSVARCHTAFRIKKDGGFSMGAGRPTSANYMLRLHITTCLTSPAYLASYWPKNSDERNQYQS